MHLNDGYIFQKLLTIFDNFYVIILFFFYLVDEDIDGIPLDKSTNDASDTVFSKIGSKPAFIPSKWETVDPQQIEAQVS